jgi:hypothetical protein
MRGLPKKLILGESLAFAIVSMGVAVGHAHRPEVRVQQYLAAKNIKQAGDPFAGIAGEEALEEQFKADFQSARKYLGELDDDSIKFEPAIEGKSSNGHRQVTIYVIIRRPVEPRMEMARFVLAEQASSSPSSPWVFVEAPKWWPAFPPAEQKPAP